MTTPTHRNNAVGPLVRSPDDEAPRRRRRRVAGITYGLLCSVAGLTAATEYFAALFDHHAALGERICPVYAPWKILEWATRYWGEYPVPFLHSTAAGIGAALAAAIPGILLARATRNRIQRHDFLHGSARWADPADIARAGLTAETDDAVFVGSYVDTNGEVRYLRHNGPEHVLAFAPTRSGKGVGLVIPTLLTWTQSAVVSDLKGELWALTAGWRQRYARNRVIRFEPALRAGGAAWNALEEIRSYEDDRGVLFDFGDIQNIATLLVDPDGKGLNDHWQKTSFALLVGVIEHAKYLERDTGQAATLPFIDRLLSDPNRPLADLWEEMVAYPHYDGQPRPTIVQAARDMLDRDPEEASSVLSTAKSFLNLYRDPVVAANVSRCDFRVRDLMTHDDAVTLYVVTEPTDKNRLRPLVRLLYNMIIRLNATELGFENGRPKANYKHRLLGMFDEFPSLGKLDILQESLAFLAGYGIKCFLIIQDMSQLRSRDAYGPDESITSNCHIQVAYPPNRLETAEHLSKLTGTTTVVTTQITVSGKRFSAMLGQVQRTYQQTSRPLLTPDEAMRMPGPVKDGSGLITAAGDMVICAAGYPAIYGRQPLYFQDPILSARAAVPAPAETDRTRCPSPTLATAAL